MADEKELKSLLPEGRLPNGSPESGDEDPKTEALAETGTEETTLYSSGPEFESRVGTGAAPGSDAGQPGPAGPTTGSQGRDAFKPVYGITILSDGTFENIRLIPLAEAGKETVECPASLIPVLVSILQQRLRLQDLSMAVQEGLKDCQFPVNLRDGRTVGVPLAEYIANVTVQTMVQAQTKLAENARIMAALGNGSLTPGGKIISHH